MNFLIQFLTSFFTPIFNNSLHRWIRFLCSNPPPTLPLEIYSRKFKKGTCRLSIGATSLIGRILK